MTRTAEAVRRLTKEKRAAFVKQIRDLVAGTAELERDKVDAAIRLLKDAVGDINQRILRARKGTFTRQMAVQTKDLVRGELRAFERAAKELFGRAQPEFARAGLDDMRALVGTQGFDAGKLALSRELVLNAATRSADLITTLTDAQVNRASNIINVGVIGGKSTFEVASEMAEEFEKSFSRMETIARTEMLGIYSQAQQAQIGELAKGAKGLRKQWVSVLDERTRPSHEEAHLQSVPWDEPFSVGGAELMFPRDPAADDPGETINCRCVHIVDYSEAEPIFEPGVTAEELPPIQEPLKGLGAKVAAELRRSEFGL